MYHKKYEKKLNIPVEFHICLIINSIKGAKVYLYARSPSAQASSENDNFPPALQARKY